MEKINVLSLFDGISCGHIALDKAGIPINKYYASEIDKYAIKVTNKNYPETINLGDVTTVSGELFTEKIDLLIGGSPCQGFSQAGKMKNFDDPRSKLFWEYVRILQEVKPKYFLLENVVMKQEWQDIISEALGVKPIMIDSSLTSAATRKRLYWTNIPIDMNYIPSDKVFSDIEYEHDYKIVDISKYKDTVKANNDNTCWKWDTSGKGYYSQQSRARSKDIKMNTLPASGGDKNNIYLGNYTYRKLHPVEAERLQTLPDNYTNCIKSNVKRIGLCGNGWTVDVIAWIFSGLKR